MQSIGSGDSLCQNPVRSLVRCACTVRLDNYRSIRGIGIDFRIIDRALVHEIQRHGHCPRFMVCSGTDIVVLTGPACHHYVITRLPGQSLRPVAVRIEIPEKPECRMTLIIFYQVACHLQRRIQNDPVRYLPGQCGLDVAL